MSKNNLTARLRRVFRPAKQSAIEAAMRLHPAGTSRGGR